MHPVLILLLATAVVGVAVWTQVNSLEQRIYDAVSTQLQRHQCASEKDRRMLAKCVTRHWIQRVGLFRAWKLTRSCSQLRVAVEDCMGYCWPSA
jgi:hypothetical protein